MRQGEANIFPLYLETEWLLPLLSNWHWGDQPENTEAVFTSKKKKRKEET